MMNRPTTTNLASGPICFHKEAGSQFTPVLPASCSKKNAQTCKCKSIVFSSLRESIFKFGRARAPLENTTPGPVLLLAQREVHVDLSHNLNRLSVEKGRLVYPMSHRFQRGRDQQRMAADRLKILNGAVLGNYGRQVHYARNAGLLGQRGVDRLRLPDQLGLL